MSGLPLISGVRDRLWNVKEGVSATRIGTSVFMYQGDRGGPAEGL